MKHSSRLAELVLRLNLNQDFQEFWEYVRVDRDNALQDAIHGTEGDPAEKRGAARALDTLVTTVEKAPDIQKKRNEAQS